MKTWPLNVLDYYDFKKEDKIKQKYDIYLI
jgi:hypothetical protein